MHKGRRVGTFTAGITLVVFGVMFLLRAVVPNVNILFIVSLWPLILVGVGIEIILATIIKKEEKLQYDFGALVLIIILVFFAMGMGGAEFIITHLSEFRRQI